MCCRASTSCKNSRNHKKTQPPNDFILRKQSIFIENYFFVWYIIIVHKQLLKDAFGWGFLLWLIGYALGIILFMIVPPPLLGWVIMPIGTIITLWVLFKKIKGKTFQHYLSLSIIWTLVAIIFDYLFLVKLFKPADGYYKLDVYAYYILTFALPLFIGLKKAQK